MSSFTRQAITDAFLRLLARKPFKKVTVRDIVEECGVNRTTFYYYYQDIYAIVEDLFSVTLAVYADVLRGRRDEENLRDTAQFISMNRRAILSLWDALGHEQMRRYTFAVTDEAMHELIDRRAEGLSLTDAEKETVFLLTRETLFGAMYLFLRDELPAGAGDIFTSAAHGLVRKSLEGIAAAKKRDGDAVPQEADQEIREGS